MPQRTTGFGSGANKPYLWLSINPLRPPAKAKHTYRLGRRAYGDVILFPLPKAYEDGGFQGYGPKGKSYDWKSWDGKPHGYEGLLVDNYQALLVVLTR